MCTCTVVLALIWNLVLSCNGLYPDCKTNRRGLEYKGTINVTENGKTCLPWNNILITLYEQFQDSDFPDKTVNEASNYCRNPINLKLGPWCFTSFYSGTNLTIGLCAIPICGVSKCKINRRGGEYRGKVNVTQNDEQCLP